MSDSTLSAKSDKAVKKKPNRPKDCQLFPHASGQWAKKIEGKLRYFGVWADLPAALQAYTAFKNGWDNPSGDGLNVKDLFNHFLDHKKSLVDEDKLRSRTWDEYRQVCEVMLSVWGPGKLVESLRPGHFEPLRERLSKGRRPKTVHNLIGRCRTVLNFAYDNAMVDNKVRWGIHFQRPSAKEIRKDQAAQDHLGERDLQANQINDVLKIASPQLKAMILLAVNVGMGNEDCARLEFRHLDLDAGCLNYPRPKTGVKRLAKLWPETIEALKGVLETRKEPKNDESKPFVFITKYGQVWFKESRTNPISAEFRKLLKTTGHHIDGVGFYSLRRTFETVAGETKDQPAVDLSMGHQSADMAALYRHRVQFHRSEAVAQHVRKWLFGKRGAK